MPRRPNLTLLLVVTLGLSGCAGPLLSPSGPAGPAVSTPAPFFRDRAAAAGIRYRLGHGEATRLSILETGSGGCAFLDYDGDGRLDVLLVGEPLPGLFRNAGGGRFTNVTESTGLRLPGRWMGCGVGDYDNDGFPDVLLTGYRCLRLLHNAAGRRFEDRTREAGLRTGLWTTSAAFFDADRDGRLDLYVAAYCDYHLGTDDLCRVGNIMAACGPEHYAAERGRFYRNRGDGRFEDLTSPMGLSGTAGKTWGVAPADVDGDGWEDLYLANDQMPGDLYLNQGGRRFRNVGVVSGTAFDAQGRVQGGMGVDWGDPDGDGRFDLLVTTYVNQSKALYRNLGRAQFQETSEESGLAVPTRPYVTFGCGFLDFDNDGDQDLMLASGHVRDNISGFDPAQDYRQPMQLLVNQGDGSFVDISQRAGEAFRTPIVGRGTAYGDYDDDGRIDALVVDLEGSARLLHNESTGGHWLSLRLVGRSSNRDAIGARVEVRTGSTRQVREVQRARSVLSASDPRVLLGLGASDRIDELVVRWPSGRISRWEGVTVDQELTLREDRVDEGIAVRLKSLKEKPSVR